MTVAPVVQILDRKFRELRAKNASFSLRAFAKRLGTSSGPLSEIMSGKRTVTDRMVRKWVQSPVFDPQERTELAREFGYMPAPAARSVEYVKISKQQMQVIAEWWHFAILSLMKTHDFKSDEEWIALRLGLRLSTVREALSRLESLNLIVRNEKKAWVRTSESVRTPDDQIDAAIQSAHAGLLQVAARKIRVLSPEVRDYTSFIMSIKPERLPQAKAMIREFQDKLSELLEQGETSEVYQLGIQLFPLSAPESERNR